MATTRGWRQLSTGIAGIAAIAVVAVAILIFGRVGALHGRKFTLYLTTDGARGVIRGTDVWLDGQKVGRVLGIAFRPPTVIPSERLVLTMHVLDEARPLIRLDTRAQIRSGGTILGDQVVALSSGTTNQRGVVDGDTIHAGAEVDLEGITSDAALASREFPGIMENVKLLAAQLRTAQGTLAAFGMDQGSTGLVRFRARTEHIFSLLGDGRGSTGLATTHRLDEALESFGALASHAIGQADSIRALLGSNAHSLGRFRRDSTLTVEIGRVRDDLVRARRLAETGPGTIGRFRTDSTLIQSVNRDLAAIDWLVDDLKKHPLRYFDY